MFTYDVTVKAQGARIDERRVSAPCPQEACNLVEQMEIADNVCKMQNLTIGTNGSTHYVQWSGLEFCARRVVNGNT